MCACLKIIKVQLKTCIQREKIKSNNNKIKFKHYNTHEKYINTNKKKKDLKGIKRNAHLKLLCNKIIMFFQRFFTRKNKRKNSKFKNNNNNYNHNMNNCSNDIENHNRPTCINKTQIPLRQEQQRGFVAAESLATSTPKHRSNSAVSAVQLTPLWEHILRTRTLPPTVCPITIFSVVVERLRDAEWQVRQHALRVLVDVLAVIRDTADAYMDAVTGQLVENLGHPAPTVRKGALDCLRVYLSETTKPDTVLLNILNIGLNQRLTNEPFGGRLTCGVLLSIPALVQCILKSNKRNFILQKTIDMLVEIMNPVTNQEITLKVLNKIRELIGNEEFIDYMSPNIFREFEMLCHIYGVGEEISCKSIQRASSSWYTQTANTSNSNYWRSSSDDRVQQTKCGPLAKVIMETEIQINDDTLTMRLLEADEHLNGNQSPQNLLENEIVYGNLVMTAKPPEVYRLMNSFSDSEIDDVHSRLKFSKVITPLTPTRTPKRVTFGGEVVKVRTPDSDAASSINTYNPRSIQNKSNESNMSVSGLGEHISEDQSNNAVNSVISAVNVNNSNMLELRPSSQNNSKTTALTVDIPNDNTKPLARSQTENSLQNQSKSQLSDGVGTTSIATDYSTVKKIESISSLSPRLSYKRLSISSIESNISPRAPHKEIEVLHNLQRDPSPARIKRTESFSPGAIFGDAYNTPINSENFDNKATVMQQHSMPRPSPPKSWEDLNIVDHATLMNLRSGNWRDRLRGITELREALSSTETLAKVQPCLDSVLRTLLSSERNYEVIDAKHRLIINLISRLPLDNLENRAMQIMTGLCRQGDPGVYGVCKALMQRLPPASIILKLTSAEFLHARSSRFLEHALQIVIYALLTFPSTCFDTTTCVANVTYAAFSRKRRVRQVALELLAVLAKIVSTRGLMELLEVVQQIAKSRDDGADLVAAVKARLSRKQLPLIASDNAVHYGLHIQSAHNLQYDVQHNNAQNKSQADIDWITSGIGSVSPTAIKRRALKNRSISQQSFRCLSQQTDEQLLKNRHSNYSDDIYTDDKVYQGNYSQLACGHNDNCQYGFQQITYGNPLPMPYMTKKSNVSDSSAYPTNRRVFVKSCSDSSMDGRSTDSTFTTSSGEGDGIKLLKTTNGIEKSPSPHINNDIRGRFTRQPVPINSRFPAMDLNIYARAQNRPNYYEGMGAHFAGLRKHQHQYFDPNMELFTKKNMNYPITNMVTTSTAQTQTQSRRKAQHKNPATNTFTNTNNNNNKNNHNYGNSNNTNEYAQDIFENAEISPKERKNPRNNVKHRQQQQNQTTLDNILNHSKESPTRRRFVNEENFPEKGIFGSSVHSTSSFLWEKISNTRSALKNVSDHVIDYICLCNGNEIPTNNILNPTESVETTNSSEVITDLCKNETCHKCALYHACLQKRLNDFAHRTPILSTTSVIDVNSSKPFEEAFEGLPLSMQGYFREERKSSAKSITYSEKSTASIPSSNSALFDSSGNIESEIDLPVFSPSVKPLVKETTEKLENVSGSPTKWSVADESLSDELDRIKIDDFNNHKDDSSTLERNASLASLQSKTESIKTQLEDGTPPVLSRAQSAKSLLIEEEIEPDAESISEIVNDDAELNIKEIYSEPNGEIVISKNVSSREREEEEADEISMHKGKYSPTIADLKAHSKSLETLYDHLPSKNDCLDNFTNSNTNTSAEENSSPCSAMPVKILPTQKKNKTTKTNISTVAKSPLKQKAKSMNFLRSKRRVSPAKQPMKLTQAELYPPTLESFEKPREAIMHAFDQLDSTEWEVIMVGLKTLVRLMRHHPEQLEQHMHMVCIQMTRSVRNLRSQVARAACQAAGELFANVKLKNLEAECDDLIAALLHRTADTNRFLRTDATQALECMCDSLTSIKVLNVLTTRGAGHQNSLVRTTTAKLLERLVTRLGYDKVYALPRDSRDKFFMTGANLLLEGSLETRRHAKSVFQHLSQHPNYERLIHSVIPTRIYRNIEKTLRSIH